MLGGNTMFFDRKITFFDLEVKNRQDALQTMGESLFAADLVTADFNKGVLEREETFPTGLAVQPYGVAIPHTDADKVISPQIAFASLKKPVKFRIMGNRKEEIDVSLIFMLAIKKAEDQLTMLQRLMEIFQNGSILTELAGCKNKEELDGILKKVGLE
ncbi:PTS sugar transporter subunit IIA [Bacillota bacterium Lsc_1132]